MTKSKPCTGPHHYFITFENSVEVGRCVKCHAVKPFDPDARRRFGNEALEPKNAAIRRPK